MRRLRSLPFLALCLSGFSSSLRAQTLDESGQSSFAPLGDGDLASNLIKFLYHNTLPQDGVMAFTQRYASFADTIKHVLGYYSLSILVLAGFIVFYQVMSLVVDTAHQGVIMGRKTNQVWAPLRLALAVLLLVPVGDGLSTGQYVVLKIASLGSNLAGHAWQRFTKPLNETFSSIIQPHTPNAAALVGIAVDMELCRLAYNQAFASQTDQPVHIAGQMGELIRLPPSRTMVETWRYTNSLNFQVPLCGEIRFSGQRRHGILPNQTLDSMVRLADEQNAFSHTEMENILVQARTLALKAGIGFLNPEIQAMPVMRQEIENLNDSVQKELSARLQNLHALSEQNVDRALTPPSEAGWIAAALFIPQVIRYEESYGEVVKATLPSIQEPVFNHPVTTLQVLSESLNNDPAFHALEHETYETIARFYALNNKINGRIALWLYENQTLFADRVGISGLDLKDQLNAAVTADSLEETLVRALDSAAVNIGVWGAGTQDVDPGNPFALSGQKKPPEAFALLIEYGRRQWELGVSLINLASQVIGQNGALIPALFVVFLGSLFGLFGVILIFVIPVLAFLRFMAAVCLWLLELLEALAAMPLVSIAHLTLTGDGLSGGLARQAYLLWFRLAIRPFLSLLGFMVGFIVMAAGLYLLAIALIPLSRLSNANGGALFTLANCGVVFLYDAAALFLSFYAFKGVSLFPAHALQWISRFVVTDTNDSQQTDRGSNPAPIVVQQRTSYSTTQGTPTPTSTSSSVDLKVHAAQFADVKGDKETSLFPSSYEKNVDRPVDTQSTQSTEGLIHTETLVSVTQTKNPRAKAQEPEGPQTSEGPLIKSNAPFFADKDKPNG